MNGLISRIDGLQRRWKVPAYLWSVQKKYSDDRGGYLSALITYYGFLSVFPLLLAAFTVVAYVLQGDQSAIRSLENHVGSYPIIGPAAHQLQGKSLHGQPFALVIGVLGLIWGAQGLAQAAQFTMEEAWNQPNRVRAGFVPRTLRSFGWYAVFGLGVVISTFISSIGAWLGWTGGDILSTLVAVVFDMGLFVLCFRIVSPRGIPVRDLVPGAAVAGVAWAILTGVGVGLVHLLAHSNSLYGTFTPVLALLGFIYLMARITILAVEANVVRARRLWPRSLTSENLTAADLAQLEQLAGKEERVETERVDVEVR
ncbi:MAG TPA: YihY/virulence factor BrkB family protein [Acidimicrobiales bacterium]|nr:YihY/virulence factor BrkB family protein [Acidimicrobiales bacterium]